MGIAASDKHKRTELHGHVHVPLPGEKQTGRSDPNSELQVTLVLRRRGESPEIHSVPDAKPSQLRNHATRHTVPLAHVALEDDIALVKRFASEYQLAVCEVAPHRRAVVLSGNVANMERAFNIALANIEHARGKYRATIGNVSVPPELSAIVQSVLGLNTRPCAKRRRVHHANTVKPFWTVPEMAREYDFPDNSSAEKQSIGIIELGGGYHESDLQTFFSSLQMPMPSIRWVSVDGVQNSPAPEDQIRQFLEIVEGKRKLSSVPEDILAAAQSTVEVTMDIELVAALAPGAEIVVYMAPNTEQGIYSAVSQAISAGKLPSSLSISWGEPESGVSEAYLNSVNEVLRDAATRGVTVCVSSGDEGAINGSLDGKPTVNFPASSPHVLTCGGSSVHKADGNGLRESVWNCVLHGMHGATGGGVSQKFDTPEWQKNHPVPKGPTGSTGRGLPDVAGPADPHHGCAIIVGGECCSSAGTSAVAPLWAALVACIHAKLDAPCEYLTPLLYELSEAGAKPFRDITEGNNGFYQAGRGWNACTGLGTPIVGRLIEALRETRSKHPIAS
jgi:kumamolisin